MWSKCLNTGPQPPHLCDGDASSTDFMIPGDAWKALLRTELRHRLRTMHRLCYLSLPLYGHCCCYPDSSQMTPHSTGLSSENPDAIANLEVSSILNLACEEGSLDSSTILPKQEQNKMQTLLLLHLSKQHLHLPTA